MQESKLAYESLTKLLGTDLFKSESMNSGFKNSLQGVISNMKFLNHLSYPFGISVTVDITSGEIGNSSTPTFEFNPVKFKANSLVTCIWPP